MRNSCEKCSDTVLKSFSIDSCYDYWGYASIFSDDSKVRDDNWYTMVQTPSSPP